MEGQKQPAGQAYSGIDYELGARVLLDGERGEIVAVGRSGNYVIALDRGNVSAHHSQLTLQAEPVR